MTHLSPGVCGFFIFFVLPFKKSCAFIKEQIKLPQLMISLLHNFHKPNKEKSPKLNENKEFARDMQQTKPIHPA